MQVQKVLNWLSATEDFHTTKILKQHWKESKYSYRTAPRPDFGMLLVMKGSIDFVTGGEVLTARAGNLVFLPKHSRYEAVFTDEADDLLVSFDTSGEEILLHAPIVLSERTPLSCVERFRALVEGHFYKELTRLQKKGLFYLLLDAVITEAEAQTRRSTLRATTSWTVIRVFQSTQVLPSTCSTGENTSRTALTVPLM